MSVTSRAEPSENFAVTFTATALTGSMRNCSRGVTSSFTSVGAPAASRFEPLAIHSRSVRYSHDSLSKRLPPSCATACVAFCSNRLSSGDSTFTRRPNWSRTSAAWS